MTGSRGFTLIEVLIAMTVLSVGILGIAGLAGTVVKSSSYSKSVTQATNIAQDKIESLLSVDFDNLQSTDTTATRTDLRRTCAQTDATAARPVYACTPSSTITKDGKTYTWAYTVTLIDLDGSGSASSDGLKRIDVTVSWVDALWNSTRSLTLTTLRSAEFVN